MTEHLTDYELVICPKYGLLDINWQELKEYRELLFFLVLREILSKIYMPRTFIPTASRLAGIVDYVIAMSILAVMIVYLQL